MLRFDRSGIPVATEGGAAGPLLRLARLGLAGPLGSGRQFWPWLTLRDEVGALLHLLDRPQVAGPVNLVGPRPSRQREVASALAGALGRPALLPAPGFAVRAVLGEFASDILGSQRVVGDVLVDSGYRHEDVDLEAAARWVVG